MSEGSSSAARSRVSAPARVWRSSPVPRQGAVPPLEVVPAPRATPLEVVPGPAVDEVTGLPLVLCPKCKILGQYSRLVAFTCRWTRNRGKRYFKCPRNEDWVPNRCDIIMVKEQYEQHLASSGYFPSISYVDVVPDLLMEEVEEVKLRLHEVKEGLAMLKLGMDEMKNKQPRCNVSCSVVVFVAVLSLFIGWILCK
ncbi:unnamed protein product [Urochloa decumbens]|uniref:Zinc finger GRF-type domain-containing protein n=1 Tax=Urochloa decumbens TaxID=240449 RepID=A0ABC9C988_9POAL